MVERTLFDDAPESDWGCSGVVRLDETI